MSPLSHQLAQNDENFDKTKSYKFIYKNKEYDCTDYAQKHPGGEIFFERMADEKKDFTEYFRTLHSKKALKILKSQPVVQNVKESEESKQFSNIKKKVKPMFEPIWSVEILIMIFLFSGLYLGVTDTKWYRSIPILTVIQIFSGWVAHSQCHSRNYYCWKLATFTGIITGLSTRWWQFKHNNHHMFTNRIGKDDDINHQYQQWQYCFLYLKWKFDSIMVSWNKREMVFIVIHWYIMFQINIYIMLISQIIAGWFSAHILIGNHEREHKFFKKIDKPFFEHQIISSRNYAWTDFFSMILMGGMQYQTEHHLFPQIPFYRLPWTVKIIREELAKLGLQVKIDRIFDQTFFSSVKI